MGLSLGLALNAAPITLALGRGGEFIFTNVEAAAYVARMNVQPNSVRKGLIDALFTALKAEPILSKLDALWLLASHDAQAARLNLVAAAYDLTPVASPTFTTDRGYAGDGSVSYLSTGFNPSTAPSPKYTQNSAHQSVWSRGAGNDTFSIGGRNGFTSRQGGFNVRNSAGQIDMRINQDSGGVLIVNANESGHFVASRTASNLTTGYRNGIALGSISQPSSAVPSVEMYLSGFNAGGSVASSTRPLAAASIGAGLHATEVTALYNALNSYLAAVGPA